MSARIKRRIKNNRDESRQRTGFLWKVDISSESDNTPSLSAEPNKAYRRKIRSTEEFNHVFMTSEEPVKSAKVQAKKTKKNNIAYNLPRISQVAEDPLIKNKNVSSKPHLELPKSEKLSNKTVKKSLTEETKYETPTLRSRKGKQNGKDTCNKYNQNRGSESDESQTYDYQSANSVISDSQGDSEVEITSKDKKKLKQNCDSDNSKDTKIVEDYTERIKKLLSDSPWSTRKKIIGKIMDEVVKVESPKRAVGSNASLDHDSESPVHDSTLTRPPNGNRPNTPNIKLQTTQHLETEQLNNVIPSQGELSRNLLKKRSKGVSFTPHPKRKPNNSFVHSNETENQLKSVDSNPPPTKKLRNNSPKSPEEREMLRKSSRINSTPYPKSIKRRTQARSDECYSEDTSQLCETDLLEFDVDLDDDVFDSRFSKNCEEKPNTEINQRVSRKSVRFTSPKQSQTPILSKSLLSNSFVKSLPDIYDKKTNESVGGSSTFDKSPEVINLCNDTCSFVKSAIEGIEESLKNCVNEKNSKVTASRSSTIDCTIPAKNRKSSSIVLCTSIENSCQGSFNRQSTFSVDNESVKIENKFSDANKMLSDDIPKLNRTATFTKDEPNMAQISNVLSSPNRDCSLQYDDLCSKTMDTSKVNKRKRWNTSRLSTSFLNDPINILDTTAPWPEVNLNGLDRSGIRESVTFQNDFNNYQLPSSTSTPVIRPKQNLLKQALSKGKFGEANNNKKENEPSVSKGSKMKKVPNFALIHQKALEKLENLQEMTERKAVRAKLLLSGHKPPVETMVKSSSKRKALKLSPFSENKSSNKPNISVTKIQNISPSTSNRKVTNKENKLTPLEKKKELVKAKSNIPRPKLPHSVLAEKKGYTRFGFKIGNGNLQTTKEEQIKAVSCKSKVPKNTVQERRIVIQGVRSNRRFELLMSMRNK